MLEEINKYVLANYNVLLIKFSGDTRFSTTDEIITHDGSKNSTSPLLRVVVTDKLSTIEPTENYIGIDEGQFFPDIVETCEKWSRMGKTIFIAALDGTFERKPFDNILSIIPIAEHAIKLTGVCMICGSFDAAFSKKITSSKEIVDIGGRDKYMIVCRRCYEHS